MEQFKKDSGFKLRQEALTPGSERDRLFSAHPVINRTARFGTAPLLEVYAIVVQMVVHYETGGCILGSPRSGKSVATQVIKTQLERTMPDVQVVIVLATYHERSSESNFYTDLLLSFGRMPNNRSSAPKDRALVMNILKDKASQLNGDRILLIVDEAQNWGFNDYLYLKDLTNRMSDWGVTVIALLFGHTELLKLRDKLLSDGRTDVMGRFLMTPRHFRGIKSQAELLDVFKAFDSPATAQYPLGSEICYSEFFLPDDWQSGWRLVHDIDQCWNAFAQVAKGSGREPNDLGMNWVMGAIKNAIFTKMTISENRRPSDYEIWLRAVEASGYAASLVLAPAVVR